MIEKLPDWPEGYTPPEHVNEALLWLKLNEVIEELNAQHHSVQTLNSISKKLEYIANPLHGLHD